jgi:hypothetical protein
VHYRTALREQLQQRQQLGITLARPHRAGLRRHRRHCRRRRRHIDAATGRRCGSRDLRAQGGRKHGAGRPRQHPARILRRPRVRPRVRPGGGGEAVPEGAAQVATVEARELGGREPRRAPLHAPQLEATRQLLLAQGLLRLRRRLTRRLRPDAA